ncbi:MAG: hypothetical protein AABX52_00040 [Nanoarchaeota archaeon]
MTISKTLYTLGLAGILSTTPYTSPHLYAQPYQLQETTKQVQNYDALFQQVLEGLGSENNFVRHVAVLKAKPIIKEYETLADLINKIAVTETKKDRECLSKELQKKYTTLTHNQYTRDIKSDKILVRETPVRPDPEAARQLLEGWKHIYDIFNKKDEKGIKEILLSIPKLREESQREKEKRNKQH